MPKKNKKAGKAAGGKGAGKGAGKAAEEKTMEPEEYLLASLDPVSAWYIALPMTWKTLFLHSATTA